MEISQSLSELEWIPKPRVTALRRLDIERVEDLLTHYPRRYEDRQEFSGFPSEESDIPVCLCGEVVKTQVRRFGGWKKIFEVTLEEEGAHALSQPLVCRWFNLHYVQKMIATGQRLIVFGKPRLRGKRLCLDHPDFEVVEPDDVEASVHFRRITPIYPATEGVSQRLLRSIVYRVLRELADEPLETPAPARLVKGERREALRGIHFPETWDELTQARQHLVASEFFSLQMLIAARRSRSVSRAGDNHAGPGALLDAFQRGLPFGLTKSQGNVIAEIRAGLATKQPMNRLLQGDVGSGKTVVAIAAMLLAVEAGYQAALMAPTQILAEQHYDVLCRWLEPLGIRIALRTSARQEESGPLPLFERAGSGPANSPGTAETRRGAHEKQAGSLRSPEDARGNGLSPGAPQVIVGTHALLYDSVPFENLGLVVIDEQHKFGVAQRARLTEREPPPDVLVMTATPIPRTLTMTAYGDLDVSIIDEMPKNRGKIVTALRDPRKLDQVLEFLRRELGAGRQVYVIYPLIDESEKVEAKAATVEYERWTTNLRPFSCELLHGRIPAPEKQQIMERFRAGKTQVLVSTTVIEVGVDVPNATVMLIENAERFGLAQLHQLRGRIGRGEHKSYCILLTSDESAETQQKLAVLVQTNNGFEIAEADWLLRGPGDLLGTAQSGLPALKIGNLREDGDLMREARVAATLIFEKDPGLEWPENQRFRPLIVEEHGRNFANVS